MRWVLAGQDAWCGVLGALCGLVGDACGLLADACFHHIRLFVAHSPVRGGMALLLTPPTMPLRAAQGSIPAGHRFNRFDGQV